MISGSAWEKSRRACCEFYFSALYSFCFCPNFSLFLIISFILSTSSPFRNRIGRKFGKRNDVDADDDDDDEGIAFENEQVLIIHKSLQAKVEKAHQIRITDQKSGIKTVTTAKRKCSICHGRAGLDSDAPAKKTDRECYHPHCRARISKSNRNITHGTFICKICEHQHYKEMARFGIVEAKVYPEYYPDQSFSGDVEEE